MERGTVNYVDTKRLDRRYRGQTFSIQKKRKGSAINFFCGKCHLKERFFFYQNQASLCKPKHFNFNTHYTPNDEKNIGRSWKELLKEVTRKLKGIGLWRELLWNWDIMSEDSDGMDGLNIVFDGRSAQIRLSLVD